jgi:hypothetical protein
MIGVAARPAQLDVVAEFFELFKTPWEVLVPGRKYPVVLSADGRTEPSDAAIALVYAAAQHPVDRCGPDVRSSIAALDASWGEATLPLYKGAATFTEARGGGALTADGGALDYRTSVDGVEVRRIGYDLFAEVEHLLGSGQPESHAHIPTLELHIAFIRQCLKEAAIPFVEIPPRPKHADFICCLTHDLDFYGIRRQRVGRTLVGFALRGTVGTFFDTVRGRRPVDEAIRNVLAVLSLPLVYIGLRRDLWQPFRDYAVADRGHKSTFFLVPFKDRAGVAPAGGVEPRRAVSYGIQDIKDELQDVVSAGCELAVHGIDAWRDAAAGRAERGELASVSDQPRTGVRMHWLYYSADSPRALDEAGFDYDSTWGYNDAVGFRSGTMQAFRPFNTQHLLELPLTIMDSALFYPDRMGLTRDQAASRCAAIVKEARRFGGAVVINWHDRSLAPERQWGRCYGELLNTIEANSGWFATADAAAEWFRWRRAIRFSGDTLSQHITVAAPEVPDGLPPARIAVHGRGVVDETSFAGGNCHLNL